MSAYLDKQRNYGDRAGGVSDPRLVRQVDLLHPAPTTQSEKEAVERILTARYRNDPETLAELTAMILPDDPHGHYVLEMP